MGNIIQLELWILNKDIEFTGADGYVTYILHSLDICPPMLFNKQTINYIIAIVDHSAL